MSMLRKEKNNHIMNDKDFSGAKLMVELHINPISVALDGPEFLNTFFMVESC